MHWLGFRAFGLVVLNFLKIELENMSPLLAFGSSFLKPWEKLKDASFFIPLCQNLGFLITHVFAFVIICANI